MAAAQLGAVLEYIRSLPADPERVEQTDGSLLSAFVNDYDQAAFEALLRRHGAMVLRVCQRTLGHAEDAEEAFQVTFLALAQRARSIRKQDSLASWLHGVACRMASSMKRSAGRRSKHEARAAQGRPRDPALSAAWQEIQEILDQEITALPETLREAFIYCCLENKSCAEAARLLRVGQGAVEMRLARARQRLQARLERRGVTLAAVLAAAAIGTDEVAAAVRPAVIRSLAQAATGLAAGRGLDGGLVSPGASDLVTGARDPMFVCKGKAIAALMVCVLALASAGFGLGPFARSSPQESPARAEAKPSSIKDEPSPAEGRGTIRVHGRVLDPDGRPLAGADLHLGHYGPKDEVVVTKQATTDAAGRFEFRCRKSQLSKAHPGHPIGDTFGAFTFERFVPRPTDAADPHFTPVGQVMATAERLGLGCDWARLDPAAGGAELTLRLVKDVAISGRILDQDGKPVPGAKLHLSSVQAYPGEDLKDAMLKFRASNEFPSSAKRWGGPLPGQAKVVTTGADGRFRVAGLGGERLVTLRLDDGPGISQGDIHVMTRPGDEEVGPEKAVDAPAVKVYAASFRHLAATSRPIRGVVTDKETGKPLAGATIRIQPSLPGALPGHGGRMLATLTDQEGRYELRGCPKSPGYDVVVQPADTGQYFAVLKKITGAPGLGPLTVDLKLPRGIPIRGKVLDQRTGKPVAGARVHYFMLYPNAGTRVFDEFAWEDSGAISGPDGSYAVAAVPGPGILVASAPDATTRARSSAYAPARVTDTEWDEFVAKYKLPPEDTKKEKWTPPDGPLKGETVAWVLTTLHPNEQGMTVLDVFNRVVLLHPNEKDQELKQDLALRPREADDGPRKGEKP